MTYQGPQGKQVRANIKTRKPDALEAMPSIPELERKQNQARDAMMNVMTRYATEMAEREVAIGLGQVTDEDGKAPDFMVQHLALKSLRQQIMGSPKQTIEQHNTSRSISFKATYEIPATPIDVHEQPEKLEIPQEMPALAPPRETVPALVASAPTPAQALKRWKETSIEAALAMPMDEYGTELPKEEK